MNAVYNIAIEKMRLEVSTSSYVEVIDSFLRSTENIAHVYSFFSDIDQFIEYVSYVCNNNV